MPKIISFILFLLTGFNLANAQEEAQIVIGTKHTLHSNILEEERAFWVNLPESYNVKSLSHQRYPVLIILDGHAHFKSISGMVNYMSAGYNGNRKIPEMIVVGIQNVNRNRDYTPDKVITKRKNVFGGGDKFLSFIEAELLPHLDQEYRTHPYNILYGHSLGGLLATHAYMKEKTLFKAFIAVDPSFGTWDAPTMDKKLDSLTDKSFERFIYIASANWGERNIRNRDRHVRLYESMNNMYESEFSAKLEYFENENHGSVPIIAFHNGISSIFEGYGISYREVTSKEQLIQHFQSISQRLSWGFTPPESLVNRLAYRKLSSGNEDDNPLAIEFFALNCKNYPNSYDAFDSLAEAYETTGDIENAIKNYKKSLELNPSNDNAEAKIAILKKD